MKALLLALFLFTVNAFAAVPLQAISPNDPDYSYYRRAVDLDREYAAQNLLGPYLDFNTAQYLKPVPGTYPVLGRAVEFLDGDQINPLNLVLRLNGTLYYVDTELATMNKVFQLRREWKNDPGIYLVVRGTRAGSNPGESVPVKISLKFATTAGKVLPTLEYSEEFAK